MASETATKRRTLRSKPRRNEGDAFALGFIAMGAIGAFARATYDAKAQRTVVAGVDLTNVDLTRPFFADFSVPATAPYKEKVRAFMRLSRAHQEFSSRFESWLIRIDADASRGRFVLHVDPAASMQLKIAKSLLEP